MESESPESYVLKVRRNSFFRFDEVGDASNSRFLDLVKLGIRALLILMAPICAKLSLKSCEIESLESHALGWN